MDIRELQPPDLDRCRALLAAEPPELCFVAEHEGAVVGVVGYVPTEPGAAHLHGPAVAVEFRRMGVGRFLAMYALRDASRRHSVARIHARAPIHAVAFLRHLGFHPASESEGMVEMVKRMEVCP
jgi:ribosomal protein S18 acetylase RimI-like enzyme